MKKYWRRDDAYSKPNQQKAQGLPRWVAYPFDNPLRRLVHPPERLLGAYVQEGMQVLDIGCGFGHFAIGMARERCALLQKPAKQGRA